MLGAGEPAALGTGLAAYWTPNGKEVHVLYVGANGQVYDWYGNGTKWANAALGNGEAAGARHRPGRILVPNRDRSTSSTSGPTVSLYEWYWDGTKWANAALGDGTASRPQ